MIFQHGLDFTHGSTLPMFLLWIVVSILALLLIYKGKLNKTYSLIIYTVVVVLGGIILGSVPNLTLSIQTLLSTIGASAPFIVILPMIIILTILLLTVF